MHLPQLISDLAIILAVAALVTFIFQKIRQPVVLGYIIAGIIVGRHTPPFDLVKDTANIQVWAELGVIFLMFTLGLEFSFRKLSRVGRSVTITGIWQVGVMIALGFLTGTALGWKVYDSLFLGAMISISSTTIIIKALDELKLKTRRFAELVFGILIVEDLVAIVVLVLLSSLVLNGSLDLMSTVAVGLRLFLIVGAWILVGYFVVPRFVKYVGQLGNSEMLTVLSVGLCLMLVSIASHFEYSPALGAFIMGSILAETRESHRIERLVQPLKDIFAAVFFVSIGMLVDPMTLIQHWPSILLISFVVVAGKVISLVAGSLATGQSLRRSIQVGFSMAQIGEFSFIIAALGATLKVTSDFLYPIIIAVSLITTFTTPYFIRISETLSEQIEKRLPNVLKTRLKQRHNVQAKATSEAQIIVSRATLSGLSCGIIITLVFQFVNRVIFPKLLVTLQSEDLAGPISWGIGILLCAPFLWAIFFIFANLWNSMRSLGGRFLTSTTFALACGLVALLSKPYLGANLPTLLAIVSAVALFWAFHAQLGASYAWFRRQFLVTFQESDQAEAAAKEKEFGHLAPWDAHLVKLQVHPHSSLVAKALVDAKLRETFGLNVVAIQRGDDTNVAPTRNELILPHDTLLCLGTDEQVDAARSVIESAKVRHASHEDLGSYELQRIGVAATSNLAQKTILESGIRDRYGGLVVGIERDGKRIVNPQSSTQIMPDDWLWVVGERGQLRRLNDEMLNPA